MTGTVGCAPSADRADGIAIAHCIIESLQVDAVDRFSLAVAVCFCVESVASTGKGVCDTHSAG
jgi:hypothetical protein